MELISDNLTLDTFVSILTKLPGTAVISLCLTNKQINQLCNRYSDRIFMELSYRDFEPFINNKGTDTWKQFYLKRLSLRGQPYLLDLYVDNQNPCNTEIGDTAKLISGDYWTNRQNKVKFNLGPRIDSGLIREIPVTEQFYKSGNKYWILVVLSQNRQYTKVFSDFSSAIKQALVFLKRLDIQNKVKDIFPYDWEYINQNYLYKSFRILFEKKGKVYYFPKKGLTNIMFIKEIRLE